MYSTCTFCHAPLGKNEALERFPVGRRVAIDQARGRLWAVCGACGQWNLSPIESRWEAIEEGERLYRDTRLRVSTDHIGLARLRDGTELIRIGEPQRPEFAAWRYGERFAKRWRYGGQIGALGGAAMVAFSKYGYFTLQAIGLGPMIAVAGAVTTTRVIERRLTAAHLDLPEIGRVRLTYAHIAHSKVIRVPEIPEGWVLRVPYEPVGVAARVARFQDPFVTLKGADARAAAARMWPRLNRGGGRKRDVADAVRMLEAHGSADSLLRLTASKGKEAEEAADRPKRVEPERVTLGRGTLPAVDTPLRLAVEMALHEDDERQALRGELNELERRWREAEEIAEIADGLFESPTVLRALERLRLR